MKPIIALVLFSITAQIVTAQTTFHGNNARTGVYQSPGPKTLKGVKWQFKTGGTIVSSPAVVNGVVYIGSSDGALYAVDQKSGQQKWKTGTRGPVASSPAVAEGINNLGANSRS